MCATRVSSVSARELSEYHETVSISSLGLDLSLRVAGESKSHARVLAEMISELPPITVHRSTLQVIDGHHRVQAAIISGQSEIAVTFFEGDDTEALIAALNANNAHGLPLTLTDRRAAASRLITLRPLWSDRRIASAVALAPQTVARIRKRSTEENHRSNVRIGLDGVLRPVSTADARTAAAELIAARPSAPLREIAKAAGISLATAHDVRQRVLRGDDPVRRRRPGQGEVGSRGLATLGNGTPPPSGTAGERALRRLTNDPSLRYTGHGRSLLQWLSRERQVVGAWRQLECRAPAHCLRMIAEVAEWNADQWRDLAARIRSRADTAES